MLSKVFNKIFVKERINYALLINDVATVKKLIKANKHLINERHKNLYGKTFLSFAAFLGKVEMVELLLNEKADPDIDQQPPIGKMGDGFVKGATPLMLACMGYSSDSYKKLLIAKLLLNANADTNVKDENGNTALSLLVEQIVRERHYDLDQPECKLEREVLELMLEKKADPNLSPVILTAVRKEPFLDKTLIEILLKTGADPTVTNHKGDAFANLGKRNKGSLNDEVTMMLKTAVIEQNKNKVRAVQQFKNSI